MTLTIRPRVLLVAGMTAPFTIRALCASVG